MSATALLGVAAGTALIRGEMGLVHRVTIETTPCSSMVRLAILMAGRTRRWLQRRRTVRAVAVSARLIGVRTDGCDVNTLRLVMAAHATRGTDREVGPEAMAVLARRWLRDADRIDDVQRRRDLAVAAATEIDRWRCEAGLAVTVPAGHVGDLDMCAMPRTVAHGPPDGRHVLGHAHRPRVATRGHDQGNQDNSDHRVVPTGWHIRHGIALNGWRLDQPGGCGLPPTPPTAWQVTHSFSPAPP